MTIRITKTKDAKHAHDFFMTLPYAHKPRHIEFNGSRDEISYDYVEGSYPTSWEAVHSLAKINLWGNPLSEDCLPVNVAEYIAYLKSKVEVSQVTLIAIKTVCDAIDRYKGSLHRVLRCHGDLTLDNVIRTPSGNIVFLDPGHHHGMPCRELDEAKLLQSLEGFDVVRKGKPQLLVFPRMQTKPLHWALLASHYIRLLAHIDHAPSRLFARQRIREITALLQR